jgi:hypothetical protein
MLSSNSIPAKFSPDPTIASVTPLKPKALLGQLTNLILPHSAAASPMDSPLQSPTSSSKSLYGLPLGMALHTDGSRPASPFNSTPARVGSPKLAMNFAQNVLAHAPSPLSPLHPITQMALVTGPPQVETTPATHYGTSLTLSELDTKVTRGVEQKQTKEKIQSSRLAHEKKLSILLSHQFL